MDKKFICGEKQYEVYGDNRAIGLPISIGDIPEEITLQGTKFSFPSPFHVTLFYTERFIDKYNIFISDFKNKVVDDFCKFTSKNKIEFIKYINDFRIVSRDGSMKSIFVRCEMNNLNEFFDFVNEKYKLNIAYPIPHVTLYNTNKGKPGWFLLDSDDLEKYTTPINNPIGRRLIIKNNHKI